MTVAANAGSLKIDNVIELSEQKSIGIRTRVQKFCGPDLLVRSRDIKLEYYPVVSPATFPSLIVFKRREVILDVLYLLFESVPILGVWFSESSIPLCGSA